jgi:predicted transcriptional regulator
MSHITIQLSPDLLAKVQSLTDSPEHLQGFVISAIEREVDRRV